MELLKPAARQASTDIGALFDSLDTGRLSLLHWLFAPPPNVKPKFWKHRFDPFALSTALLWIVPYTIVQFKYPDRLFGDSGLFSGDLHYEWVMAAWCIFTIPTLVCFLLHERYMYSNNLKEVVNDGVLSFRTPDRTPALIEKWNRRFGYLNVSGQLLGLLVGGLNACVHYMLIFPYGKVGAWGGADGHLHLDGILCIFWQLPITYGLMSFYVWRGLVAVFLLKDVSETLEIHPRPSHHDNCGGLAPVGRFGVRTAYLMAVVGINIAVLWWAAKSGRFLGPEFKTIITTAVIAYLIIGPSLIIVPLLPYARKMKEVKISRLSAVSLRIKTELNKVNATVSTRGLSKPSSDSLQRLEDYRAMVNRYPTWPFDTKTQNRFVSAYAFPLAALIFTKLINALFPFANN